MRPLWLMVALVASSCTFDYGALKGKAAASDGAADAPFATADSGGAEAGSVDAMADGRLIGDSAADKPADLPVFAPDSGTGDGGGDTGTGGTSGNGDAGVPDASGAQPDVPTGGTDGGPTGLGGSGGSGGSGDAGVRDASDGPADLPIGGTGGVVGTGGNLGTGGSTGLGAGGSSGTGGTGTGGAATGGTGSGGTAGASGSAGTTGTGGTTSGAGTTSTGDTTSTGGTTSSGSTTNSGGTSNSGGTTSLGGMIGSGGTTQGEDAGACQCNGTGPGNTPVTVSCGQSTCGSDYLAYSCSDSGWAWTGQSCGGVVDAAPSQPDAQATPVFVAAGGGRGPLSTTIITNTTSVDTVPTVNNQTMRVMLRTTVGGAQVTVKLTNRFSSVPLPVGAAHVAIRNSGGTIVSGSDRTLTFGGASTVTVAANAEAWSDPVSLTVTRGQTLAISVYVTGNLTPTTESGRGNLSWMTHYLSSAGDNTSKLTMPGTATTHTILFVAEVRVLPAVPAATLVTLGDSITEGACSTAANGDWPDLLSDRLPTLPDGTPVSVFNAGIGSGRFESSDGAGLSGIKRLPDLLALPSVRWVTILMGVNDISYDGATATDLIAAYQSAVAQAHVAGVKVIGIPILPFRHSTKDVGTNWATAQTVNAWVRTAGNFDAVIDFEPVVGDSADSGSLKASLTCDHVHPNQAGYAAMANAIDLSIFR